MKYQQVTICVVHGFIPATNPWPKWFTELIMIGDITVDQWHVRSLRNGGEIIGLIENMIYIVENQIKNGVNKLYSMNSEQFYKTYTPVRE